MQTALTFLRLILPDQGYLSCFVNPPGRNQFFASHPELVEFMLREGRHTDVYHACSAFSRAGSRKAADVWGVKALWLDVDGKDYPAVDDVLGLAYQFFAKAGLPAPLVVSSGSLNSYHFYWPLTRPIALADWQVLAGGLKALCAQLDFKADPSRTADAASVLRTPGTLNHKHKPPRPVSIVKWCEPYAPEALAFLAQYAMPAQPKRVAPVRGSIAARALAGLDGPPADPDRVAERCQQVRWGVEHQAQAPEPFWRLLLGVVKHCDHADEMAQEWSCEHPTYSPAETQAKLDHWTSGPPLCTTFEATRPGGCDGCPFRGRISTPVQCGRDADVADVEVPPEPPAEDAPVTVVARELALVMPEGFSIRSDNSLWFLSEKGGEKVWHKVLDIACGLMSWGKRKSDQAFVCVYAQWKPREQTYEMFPLPASTIESSTMLSQFAAAGVIVTDKELFRKYLRDAVTKYKKERPEVEMHEHMGWNREGFLLGNLLIPYDRERNLERVPMPTNAMAIKSDKLAEAQGGSIEGWIEAAKRWFRYAGQARPGVRDQAAKFAVLSSFGAPLMHFINEDEGGAILSLAQAGSGTGKTTTITAAATVWGRREGLEVGNRSSLTATSVILGVLHNLPVIVDELSLYEPSVLAEFIQMFTLGIDKERLERNADLRGARQSWATIMLSGSNKQVHGTLLGYSKVAEAMANRVLEMPIHMDMAQMKADNVKMDDLMSQFQKNAGYIGRPFIHYVTRNHEAIRARVHGRLSILRKELDLPPEFRYWLRLMACAYVAGEIIQKMGWFEVDLDEMFRVWLYPYVRHAQDGVKVTTVESLTNDAEEALAKFLAEHHNNILVFSQPFHPKLPATPDNAVTVRAPVVGRRERFNHTLWIDKSHFRRWLTLRGLNAKEVEDGLERLGALRDVPPTRQQRTLGAGTEWAAGRVYCLEFDTRPLDNIEGIDQGGAGNVVPLTQGRPRPVPGASPRGASDQG